MTENINNGLGRLIYAHDFKTPPQWTRVADAIAFGHRCARAELNDILLKTHNNSWLTRTAHIAGLGSLTKAVSVYPDNPEKNRPSVQGAAVLFNDVTGAVDAVIENDLITRYKTAADSLLGARFLARAESQTLLVVGAGVVAGDLIRAYHAGFPNLKKYMMWNRSAPRARSLCAKLQKEGIEVEPVMNLESAVRQSDMIATATMSHEPLIRGTWIQEGTHLDLVGAFTPQMRECDDDAITTSALFVDCRETTETKIGEIADPIQRGIITADDIQGDLYDLCAGTIGRSNDQQRTLFKNGGGAHIDLMVARYLYDLATESDSHRDSM